MLQSTLSSWSLVIAGLTLLTLLGLVSLGESTSASSHNKRNVDSEMGAFNMPLEEDINLPGLVSAILPGNPTVPQVPVPTTGLLGSVISILNPSVTVPGGSQTSTTDASGGGILGGLLSALSSMTPPPAVPTDAGLVPDLAVVDGVVSAIGGVIGQAGGGGGGLLDQIKSNVLGPVTSIAADPAAILNDPVNAVNGLGSKVSELLGSVPSAVAAGVQLANNVGEQAAVALNSTGDILGVPDLISPLADQVGSLLGAGSDMASALPNAALSVVNSVEGILTSVPGLGAAVGGILDGLKQDISSALNDDSVTSLVAAVNQNVISALPSPLQSLVSVAATATAASSSTQGTAPPSSQAPIASVLASLSSSLGSDTSQTGAITNSALSGLSSLVSQISQLSAAQATAAGTPQTDQLPTALSISSVAAQTTIFEIRTLTEVITASASGCSPSSCDCGTTSGPSPTSPTGTATAGNGTGPCPGLGYTCDDCLDGWFCPPQQTPALPAPCGYGWPCYHCEDHWFCVPSGTETTTSGTTPTKAIPTLHPATNGFQYAGCYIDSASRALRDATLLTVTGGMTNSECIAYCQSQGYSLAGTEFGEECYCGNQILDSYLQSNDECNVTCAGDPGTMCGGSWSLSIWSPDGSVLQGQDPEHRFTLPHTPGYYHPAGVRATAKVVTAVVQAWPPPLPPSSSTVTATLDLAGLESAMLSAVALKASDMAALGLANAVIQSVESVIGNGISSIANDFNTTSATALITGPSNLPMGPGPVVTTGSDGQPLPFSTASVTARNGWRWHGRRAHRA